MLQRKDETMKHMMKVGCCLAAVVGVVLFASSRAAAKGIEEIFDTATSSGDNAPGDTRFQASNAFIASYWLAGANLSTYSECFI